MDELFRTLNEWFLFFFEDNRYHLSDSRVGSGFGNAMIEFRSDVLVWHLVRDRGQLYLVCRPPNPKLRWSGECSPAKLYVLITGQRSDFVELTAPAAEWLRQNLSEIEERFAPTRLEQTLADLKGIGGAESIFV